MTVNSQSKGAVSCSPEERLQLMKSIGWGGCLWRRTSCLASYVGAQSWRQRRWGIAISSSKTDQNAPSGMSATREHLLQSGTHSVKPIVLSPWEGFSIKFLLRSFFFPSDLFLAGFFLLRYCKVNSNECCNSSLGLDFCSALQWTYDSVSLFVKWRSRQTQKGSIILSPTV